MFHLHFLLNFFVSEDDNETLKPLCSYHCFIVLLHTIKQCLWPLPHLSSHLFEKAVNQPGFARKTIRTVFGSLLGLPGICTHSCLPVLDFMTLITVNKSEHKADFLLDMLGLKKYKTMTRLFYFIFNCTSLEFWVHSKNESKVQRFPIYHLPSLINSFCHHHPPPSEWHICYSWWTYIDTFFHPNSIVDIRVHSWCCILCGFGQMHDIFYHSGIMQSILLP